MFEKYISRLSLAAPQISKRVIQLQAENSILRARVASLDDETARLRLVLAQRQQNNNTNITS